jgi:small subunit ribosomal protein S8
MDPIANMFIQLKNAGRVGQKETRVKYSKVNTSILQILKDKGFITNLSIEKKDNQKYPSSILVTLKFKNEKELSFTDIKKVSTPGRRIYITASHINKARRGKAEIVVSTSKGMMSGNDANRRGLGGELICEVI